MTCLSAMLPDKAVFVGVRTMPFHRHDRCARTLPGLRDQVLQADMLRQSAHSLKFRWKVLAKTDSTAFPISISDADGG
jgi:hypothetical protein